MNIEIYQPELEALIREHMASGAFRDVEEVLLYALKSAPASAQTKFASPASRKSLAQLSAESPFKGTEMEFPRDNAPLRPVDLSHVSDLS